MDKDRDRIYFISCSNAVSEDRRELIERTAGFISGLGYEPVFTDCIYRIDGSVFCGTPKMRADELMRCFNDPRTAMIFDVSGGDISNGILPYLDFDMIRKSKAVFWGYSDLSAVINAMDKISGKHSVLYHPLNLVKGEWQEKAFSSFVRDGSRELFHIDCELICGSHMKGRLVGGNIRCLLKLAGTRYWPELKGRILLLEALRGGAPQMSAFLSQLSQMGAFDELSGILLGTFTELDRSKAEPGIEELLLSVTGGRLPIGRTLQIGHGDDAHAALIGGYYEFGIQP